MNKIKWMFIVTFMFGIVSFNCTSVRAEEIGVGTEIDTSVFEYERSSIFGEWDGTYTITKYNGTDETVVIPSEIDGKKIKRIASHILNDENNVRHLIISNGIKEIDFCAFAMCKNLEEVILPEGITHIGMGAFSGCENIINIDIPDSVKTIDREAFAGCIKLSNIKLPYGINSIEYGSFLNCRSLKDIMLPNSIKTIDLHAFAGCNTLTKIIIPDSVEYMENNIFVDCNDDIISNNITLKNVVIYANSSSYARKYANQKGIKFSCLNFHDWDNGIITVNPTLINKGQKTFTCTACNLKKTEEISKLDLPQKGRNITDVKSKNTYKVTNPAIQNGTVEFTASDTTKRSITIPESVIIDGAVYKVTSVSKNAFKNNKKIKKVTIGKNVKTIGSNTFSGCKNLRTIIVKSKQIKTVGKNAFKGIHSKAEIKVPKKKLKSYRKMFSKKGLKDSVKIIK